MTVFSLSIARAVYAPFCQMENPNRWMHARRLWTCAFASRNVSELIGRLEIKLIDRLEIRDHTNTIHLNCCCTV